MKGIYLFFISISFFVSLKSSAQTTDEEYNYMKRGYAVSLAEGLDIKAGYKIEKGKIDTLYGRAIQLIYLTRSNGTVAGIIYAHQRIDTIPLPKIYLCIPNPQSSKDMIDKCRRDFKINLERNLARNNSNSEMSDIDFLWNCLMETIGKFKIK